jgi:hypothetical protein
VQTPTLHDLFRRWAPCNLRPPADTRVER